MKTKCKLAAIAAIMAVGATVMSCSGTSSSSSDAASDRSPEIIDSVAIHQIDTNHNILESWDMGNLPAGKNVREAIVIYNPDRDSGFRIMSIDADSILGKCRPSLDSIEPGMLISVDFKLRVPEKKGPFDATMRIHYKNVRKPSIFKVHGYAE